jgi:hypothetical protein
LMRGGVSLLLALMILITIYDVARFFWHFIKLRTIINIRILKCLI